MNRAAFFAAIRRDPFEGTMTQSQVDGVNFILDTWDADGALIDPRWLAYCLATAYHETAHTMQPVREAYWMPDEWRRKHLRYYPYYGRGLVQITWKENYEKYGIADNPDAALEPQRAAAIMFDGMVKGTFTGKKLADYFPPDGPADWHNARRIINGTDRAAMVAGYAKAFHGAILAASGVVPEAPEEAAPAPDFQPPVNANRDSPAKPAWSWTLLLEKLKLVASFLGLGGLWAADGALDPAAVPAAHGTFQAIAAPIGGPKVLIGLIILAVILLSVASYWRTRRKIAAGTHVVEPLRKVS